MLRINKTGLVCILIFTQIAAFAQNNTNSPYTRYGYGELGNRSFGAGRAMGGLGYGLRSSKQINPMNPASYSSMDSLTFIFDFGAMAQLSWFDDGTNRQKDTNGNVEYMAMQFPLSRSLAMSVGLLPFSHVGYSYGTEQTSNGLTYINTYSGSGGVTELYAGLSYDLWKNRLALGANIGYLFGDVKHDRYSSSSSSGSYPLSISQRLRVRDLKYDFGIQYTHPLSKTDKITLGLTFSPKANLNTTSYTQMLLQYTGSTSETDTIKNPSNAFGLPNSLGFGFTYTRGNKWMVGADVLHEQWGDAKFFDTKDGFQDRLRVALGGEYIPNIIGRSFLKRMRYRGGLHYSNSYQKFEVMESQSREGYKEYGASVGLGLPLIDNRSFLNLSFEYVKISPDAKFMIDEQYFRFAINYTFNEFWFFKRKVE